MSAGPASGPDLEPRLALLLALADDELVLGHRHSEWTGWAPHIEEDLAFSSIAQDEMAHARLLYGVARDAGLDDRDEDAMALGRRPEEYRHAVLCERPNRDWGYTLARHYLYDTADRVRLEALEGSPWEALADAVRLIRLEERYHLEHATAWFDRLAEGSSITARQRFAEGLEACIGEAVALFEPVPGEEALLADGTLPASNEDLLGRWLAEMGEAFEAASLDFVFERHAPTTGEMVPTSSGAIEGEPHQLTVPGVIRQGGRWVHQGEFVGAGGRRGRHSDDFLPLWEEMTTLYRTHPGARW